LQVSGVEELGVLADSYTVFDDPTIISADPHLPGHIFAERINEKLIRSKKKEIFIYVHGYKVVFDNPMLVAMELWHFLGYEGVFIAYAWPSTPSRWAYFADLETAALSTRNLRLFLQYLARETNAEKIHILGYSAGTRLVIDTLAQIALLHADDDKATLKKELKIGNVILTGSDYDLDLFGGLVVDGLLKVAEHHTIYLSGTDKALGVSNWVFSGRNRLGQVWRDLENDAPATEFLRNREDLIVIDVSEAEQSASGNGHAYFRKSPWVSSDILATLRYGLTPADRGLVLSPELPIWTFPADYIDKLRSVLIEVNPDLAGDRGNKEISR
jgi:esterase/lipase superfamily enzyme